MNQHFDPEFRDGSITDEERELRRHILEILEEAGDSLPIDDIFEQVLYRTTKQDLDRLIQEGQIVRLECGSYALARAVSQRTHNGE